MKRLLLSIIALLVLAFFNDSIAQLRTNVTKDKAMDKGASDKAANSSSFVIGKAAYAKKVLELWKDFDDNNFDRHDYIADSVIMMFPNGMVTKGKEANMEEVKKFRATLGTVKSVIHACIPITNTDAKEDAVCIWGTEEDTSPDGKVEKKDLHEVWWFNKAGKVIRMMQWAATFKEQ